MRPALAPLRSAVALAWLGAALAGPAPAAAQALGLGGGLAGLQPSRLCRPAIDLAERRYGIPGQLLQAIGRVESGRRDPASGEVSPWPWTVNAEGQGAYFDTKQQAIAAVNALRARGVTSMDVGCMQVNLMHHPNAFASLEQAFDPAANADYAARFLRKLFDQTGGWPKATAWYHSATAERGEDYQQKVMAVWPEEQKRPAAGGPAALAAAWGATMPRGLAAGGQAILGRQETGRIIPLPAAAMAGGAGGTAPGRGLDAYRAAPVTWAYQPPMPVPPAPPGPQAQGAAARQPWFFMRR